MNPGTERLQAFVSLEELKAIDEFRFRNRMPSRAAAVRELLRRGLAVSARHSTLPKNKRKSIT
jgi:hypothetical protein